jgi:hypothetical protein
MNIRQLLFRFSTPALILLITCRAYSQEAVEQNSITAEPTPIPRETTKKKTTESTVQSSSHTTTDLQDSMTATEFKAAGLNKLSEEELRNLNKWLQGYRHKAETKASEQATEEANKKSATQSRTKMNVINSRVDGEFTGLTGSTVIRLEDGTMWKQADPKDRYKGRVTDHPPVAVVHNVFGYKMQIVGTPEFYVNPVQQ